jgi:hypothetical protein
MSTIIVFIDGGNVTDIVTDEEFNGTVYVVDNDNLRVTDEYDHQDLLACDFVVNKNDNYIKRLFNMKVGRYKRKEI